MIRALFPIERAAAPAEGAAKSRKHRFVISSQTRDAYGRIVIQDFDFSRFAASPSIFWNHQQSASMFGGPWELSIPLGFGSDWAVEGAGTPDAKTSMDINIVSVEACPFADIINAGINEGSIGAVSIGWEPGEVVVSPEGDLILSKNTLVEVSVVGIPANPEAVRIHNANAFKALRAMAKQPKEKQMKQLARILGLAETASQADIEKAAADLVVAHNTTATEVAALRTSAARVAELEAKLAEGAKKEHDDKRAALLKAGRDAGKLTKANEAQFLAICGEDSEGSGLDLAKFGALLDTLQPAFNTAAAKTGGESETETHGLTEKQLAKCKANGWDPAEFAARLKQNLRAVGTAADDDEGEDQ